MTAKEFWATHCRWCGHDRHDLRDDVRCDVIVGSDGGPTPEPRHCECLQWSDFLAMVARREAAAHARGVAEERARLEGGLLQWLEDHAGHRHDIASFHQYHGDGRYLTCRRCPEETDFVLPVLAQDAPRGRETAPDASRLPEVTE